MTYSADEGRREILDALEFSIEDLADAVAALSTAYELVDEDTGDRLEATMFRPVQQAYGLAQRTHTGFAARVNLTPDDVRDGHSPAPSTSAKGLIEAAADHAAIADGRLADLQDSMLPVEVGDADLRGALAEIRTKLDHVRHAAHELQRTLGR